MRVCSGILWNVNTVGWVIGIHTPSPTELYSYYVERFTLEFLAPPSKVRELLGEGRTVPYMVGVFGVPLPKLVWWVEECQLRI